MESLAAIMPRFNWVVHDFALKLVDPAGGAITTDQYLEEAIAPTPTGTTSTRPTGGGSGDPRPSSKT